MSDRHRDALREQATNEREQGKALGNDEAVRAAEKRLAALGEETRAEPESAPTEATPARSRQTKRG